MSGKGNKGKNLLVPVKEANPVKRSRDDLDTADDPVESFDELLVRMKGMFQNTNEKIDSCKADLQAEFATLRDDVQQFKTECSLEIKKLSDSLINTQDAVSLNAERHLSNAKSNDLLLSGVPYEPSEDLNAVVRRASLALGFSEQELPLVYTKRLARPPIVAGTTPPILLQFAFRIARDDFYYRYLSSRTLSLSNLGFDVNKRVYLNENLTDHARTIKTGAIKLKKAGKLHSVYTKGGFVFVKETATDDARPVYSLEQLAE